MSLIMQPGSARTRLLSQTGQVRSYDLHLPPWIVSRIETYSILNGLKLFFKWIVFLLGFFDEDTRFNHEGFVFRVAYLNRIEHLEDVQSGRRIEIDVYVISLFHGHKMPVARRFSAAYDKRSSMSNRPQSFREFFDRVTGNVSMDPRKWQ